MSSAHSGNVDRDPAQLRAWQREIERFLAEALRLELKPEPRLRSVADGADFLGYIVRPHYRLVRRRVVGNLRERLRAFERAHVSPTAICLPPASRDQLRAVLASYLGHFAHADADRLTGSLFDQFPWLRWLFDRWQGGLRPRWEPPGVTSLASQGRYFRETFAPAAILVQLGNRVALLGDDCERVLGAAPWLATARSCNHTFAS